MSHLPPSSAIFSPSIARAAASQAKDWSYIDTWLSQKFPNRPSPPQFERNPSTLRALLSLASANEQADEQRTLLSSLESSTLSSLPRSSSPSPKDLILSSLIQSLSREGSLALTTLSQLSLILPSPPSTLPESIISLSTQLHALETTILRLETLTSHLSSLTQSSQQISPPSPGRPSSSHSDSPESSSQTGYHPPSNLAISNLSTQKRIKTLGAKIPELKDRLNSISKQSSGVKEISFEELRKEEELYLGLLEEKRALDEQLASFSGLPTDLDAARQELEGLREELRRVTERRDEVFEGLVERETPKKGGGIRR
ncbi:hypothetical protein QBC38DRAFT_475802 [Podospora fimiseda]|uniref:HAUS augmin-like complex subunit 1 n=1 Tax=Podospora fimiseda TaxID=252190 RepID=A0AAN7BRH9_9PEZI|nr:hypothetical protein QBC38DRAFT_475802 [Podospora fimiseda]